MSVSKTYNRPDAPPVQEIREGEFFAQVGPSGRGKCCGRSTILNMMARLLPPSTGEISVAGRSVNGPSSSTGTVFQKATLLRWLTVKPMIVNAGGVIALDSLTLTA